MPNRFGYITRSLRYLVVTIAAFAVGSATIASASTGAFPIGSLFYISQVNGVATTPCNSSTSPSGTTTTCNAVVDSRGQLSTSDADTHTALARNQYDGAGNLKVTSQGTSTVSGSVSVNNLPAVQAVSGRVGVNNLPAVQAVSGGVDVNNFPATQAVSGNVGVSGTVNVGNLPATQTVHVDNLPASSGTPVANKVQSVAISLADSSSTDVPVHMTVTYGRFSGCTNQYLYLTGGGYLQIPGSETIAFPAGGVSVDHIHINNFQLLGGGCTTDTQLVGY